jgi:hypothetical protein
MRKRFIANAFIRETSGRSNVFYPATITLTADFLPPIEDVRTALRASGFLLNTVSSIEEVGNDK